MVIFNGIEKYSSGHCLYTKSIMFIRYGDDKCDKEQEVLCHHYFQPAFTEKPLPETAEGARPCWQQQLILCPIAIWKRFASPVMPRRV